MACGQSQQRMKNALMLIGKGQNVFAERVICAFCMNGEKSTQFPVDYTVVRESSQRSADTQHGLQ
jgi:hypothetical protein